LGVVCCRAVALVGVIYLAVIGSWLAIVRTPAAPIGDPYLLAMELLTIASAVGIAGWVIAQLLLATPRQRAFALAAFATGISASVLTISVHLVQLTAVRQMWRHGSLDDYTLVWPSPLFAVEYVAWDFFVGLTMILLGLSLRTEGVTRGSLLLIAGGCLCLVGLTGLAFGAHSLQDIAVFGYGVLLPLAAYRTAATFRAPTSSRAPLYT
jgi:hypothetical protein